jgi:hypothetical protein
VARSLADRDYAELPRLKRIFLKLHVLLCFVCGRYHRHLMRFQDGVRRYRNAESSRTTPPEGEFCLLGEERESIRRAMDSAPDQLDSDSRS